MARVSVIIPAYNTSAFLQDALDSVLRQTYTDWEVVLVDDGSTDDTSILVHRAMPAFDGRLRYVYQTNRGLPAARNTAIRHSTGDLIALLDADDVWRERRLELGVALMDSDPQLGLVHAKVARIDVRGEVCEYPPSPPSQFLRGSIAHHIYTRRAHLLCPTILFRKECIASVGPFDETMQSTEDRDLWFRIARRWKVGYIEEILANYRISPNSMSRNAERMLKWQKYFIEKYLQQGACSKGAARQAIGAVYRERGDALFNAGETVQSLRWYLRSVLSYPFSYANDRMLLRAMAEPVLARFLKRRQVSTGPSTRTGDEQERGVATHYHS
jgi:glycosyltransferase involved in cell wall biosynthesis